MADQQPGTAVRRGPRDAVLTGLAATSAYGRGAEALLAGALTGEPAFAPVRRFEVGARRVRTAATMAGDPDLAEELGSAIDAACDQAHLGSAERAATGLLLAIHGDPDLPRAAEADRVQHSPAAFATRLAAQAGLDPARSRTYTCACVAASTALCDAASAITAGRADRYVLAAGYLVEPDQFALFDAGRALATDGQVRPFSTGRTGLLLGDGVAAAVLEAATVAADRAVPALARVAGWGRAGDGYHVVAPRPDGAGLAAAITAALARGGISGERLGYINAHGSGTPQSDRAESAGLRRALGAAAGTVPISSTKSLHGQALEASGLLELALTVLALRAGRLPVNAGYLSPDPDCPLDVITDSARGTGQEYALTLNSAFGGAHTAILVGTP